MLHLDTWGDQGYWLLLPLLLLAACAGRRGWLFCLPLLLLGAPQLNIFSIGFPLTLVLGMGIFWIGMADILKDRKSNV